MRKAVAFYIILLYSIILVAQERAHGHLIVWHHDSVRGVIREDFMNTFSAHDLSEEQTLSPELNIILYTFDHRSIDEEEMLALVRQDSRVHLAQFNPYMTLRTNERHDPFIPNDQNFPQAWHLRNTGQSGGTAGVDIRATLGWAAAIEAENKNEREVVIAVIDGMHTTALSHSDINWWKNNTGFCHRVEGGEMHGLSCPNNPVCDYHGWNGNTNQPLTLSHSGSSTHGLHVSGISGATTNNELGVASIGSINSPNLKIMPIHIGMSGQLNSEAINSFNYLLRVRTLYNQTNGEYGAFIVAHNNSWGIDAGLADQYPVWTALYDHLGAQGLLATIAIDNNSTRNIDTYGDMPGTVTSPWAIKVTRINRQGTRTGAFGPTLVQLAAPGDNIWSTRPSNAYGDQGGGTSFAAPMVAGFIGLMYQVASEKLLQAFADNPGELAIIFKDLLLENVTPMANLDGQTVTGGRLNSYEPILGVIELNEQYDVDPDDKIPFTIFDFEGDTLIPSFGIGVLSYTGGAGPASQGEFAIGWTGNGTGGRAWNTSQYPSQGVAPETAGINVQISTVGFENIHISWNNLNSNTGANRTRLQYTVDGVNWINFYANSTNATNIRYFNNNAGSPEDIGFDNGLFVTLLNYWYKRTVDLSDIAGVSNNPHFGVRFVTAFPSDSNEYGATGAGSNYGSSGTIRYDNLVFYCTNTVDVEVVETPAATPSGGTFLVPVDVSLTTETANASIYYTTDGSIPDSQTGILYTSPIAINTSTLLRFVAKKDGMIPSIVVTENYDIFTQINSLSELRNFTPDTGEIFHITSQVLVSMTQPSFRNQIYIQDSAAGILIDDNTNIINPTYSIGDGVTGLVGELNMLDGMLQFVPITNSGTVTSTGNLITPIYATFTELNADIDIYQARLVKVFGVQFATEGTFINGTDYSISDNTGTFTFRTNFYDADYIGTPLPEEMVHLTGIISTRNTGSHITARDAADIEEYDNSLLPPRNLSAVVEGDTVVLVWDPPDLTTSLGMVKNEQRNIVQKQNTMHKDGRANLYNTDLIGYNVYRDGKLLTEIPIEDTHYFDEELEKDMRYTYGVTAVYNNGESSGENASVIVPALNPPRDFQGSLSGTNYAIELIWHVPEPEVFASLLGYNIYREGLQLNSELIKEEYFLDDFSVVKDKSIVIIYHLIAVYDLGESIEVVTDVIILSDLGNDATPLKTALESNYPNPFNPETVISFTIESSGNVCLEIFNIRGQKIKTLLNEFKDKGHHKKTWNGIDDSGNLVGSGIYFYRMMTEDYISVKKMILMK